MSVTVPFPEPYVVKPSNWTTRLSSKFSPSSNARSDPNPPSDSQHVRVLTAAKLVWLTFFVVSGGPYGIEDCLRSGGAFWSLLGFSALPILYAIPQALVTAELSTMMSQNGGYVVWTSRAFGSFGAWMTAYCSMASNIFDGALYPVLTVAYLKHIWPGMSHPVAYLLKVLVVILCVILNLRGLDSISNLSFFTTLVVTIPFGLAMMWRLSYVDPAEQWTGVAREPDWSLFISTILWIYTGSINVGSFAGEVVDPGRTYLRGVGGGILLSSLMYIVPTVVALTFHGAAQSQVSGDSSWTGLQDLNDFSYWEEGYFAQMGGWIVPWLGQAIVLGAALSGFNQFDTNLCTSSWALWAMGKETTAEPPAPPSQLIQSELWTEQIEETLQQVREDLLANRPVTLNLLQNEFADEADAAEPMGGEDGGPRQPGGTAIDIFGLGTDVRGVQEVEEVSDDGIVRRRRGPSSAVSVSHSSILRRLRSRYESELFSEGEEDEEGATGAEAGGLVGATKLTRQGPNVRTPRRSGKYSLGSPDGRKAGRSRRSPQPLSPRQPTRPPFYEIPSDDEQDVEDGSGRDLDDEEIIEEAVEQLRLDWTNRSSMQRLSNIPERPPRSLLGIQGSLSGSSVGEEEFAPLEAWDEDERPRAVGWAGNVLQSSGPRLMLPSFMSYRNQDGQGAPVAAILFQGVAVSSLLLFDFEFLVQCDTFLNCVSMLLVFGAFLRLRYSEPYALRPFTVPGGILGAWIVSIPNALVCLTAILLCSQATLLVSGGLVCAFALLYLLVWMWQAFFGRLREEEDEEEKSFSRSRQTNYGSVAHVL